MIFRETRRIRNKPGFFRVKRSSSRRFPLPGRGKRGGSQERKGNLSARPGAAICALAIFCGLFACQQVQKPELKGEGPLAVTVARGTTTPEYHAPAERWRVSHGRAINRGDFSRRECVLCHNPETGCNRCHGYVAAQRIVVPEAGLYWAEGKKYSGALSDRAD